ncbi:MAG: hypothetical protein JHC93_03150 [Parachlamydiales bacterium]|nr:hypothetical protein [Parachlamydiales bacterium]
MSFTISTSNNLNKIFSHYEIPFSSKMEDRIACKRKGDFILNTFTWYANTHGLSKVVYTLSEIFKAFLSALAPGLTIRSDFQKCVEILSHSEYEHQQVGRREMDLLKHSLKCSFSPRDYQIAKENLYSANLKRKKIKENASQFLNRAMNDIRTLKIK